MGAIQHSNVHPRGALEFLQPAGIMRAAGTTVPTDGTAGYLPGCLFHQTDGAAGTVLYVNEGTVSACDFNAVKLPGVDLQTLTATAAELNTMSGILADVNELNRVADNSTRLVTVTAATLAVTEAAHDKKVVILDRAAGITVTLPAATGSGAEFFFVVGPTALSAASHVIKVADNTDEFRGIAVGADDDGEGATGYTWKADDDDDTVTMDGTATGGKYGDSWRFIDIGSNIWYVEGRLKQSGGSEATPFSATV